MKTTLLILLSTLANIAVSATSLRPLSLDTLFSSADYVAIVQIQSGAMVEGEGARYHATVTILIKGDKLAKEIDFGPFAGLGIGSYYMVFLQRDSAGRFMIMFQGFGSFALNTTHLNKDPMYLARHTRMDDVAKILTSHIILPAALKSYPTDDSKRVLSDDRIWGAKWVKQEDLINYLQHLPNR